MKQKQLCRQQTNIELELLGRRSIVKEDLIASVRNLSALATLYRSVVCSFLCVPGALGFINVFTVMVCTRIKWIKKETQRFIDIAIICYISKRLGFFYKCYTVKPYPLCPSTATAARQRRWAASVAFVKRNVFVSFRLKLQR